jgi:hypothetical protein
MQYFCLPVRILSVTVPASPTRGDKPLSCVYEWISASYEVNISANKVYKELSRFPQSPVVTRHREENFAYRAKRWSARLSGICTL